MLDSSVMPASISVSNPFPPILSGGKWLRTAEAKWQMRGIAYGPFKPNSRGEAFPEDVALIADLRHIRELGFNTVRLYELPTASVLQAATEHGLRLLVGIPWTDHVDFLRDHGLKKEISRRIAEAVGRFRDEPCVFGFLVGNEIEKTLVRWMGPTRVRDFLEGLIETGRGISPQKLFSYATYPSTEYLIPRNADFLAVNLYLEQPEALASYLQRLQNLAGNKPLVITEFGLDVGVHGEAAQAETRRWFNQICVNSAVAGTVWFSYTDEWFRGGVEVTQWKFGLVDAARRDREAAFSPPSSELNLQATDERKLRFSVIVCTYNGTATLRACLESLERLRYPDFEVLLIDDGSTQDIAAIAHDFPGVRYVRQAHAGLSVARNLGASLATGEILAYTDDDCIADEDWLTYLSLGFADQQWVAAGGPNIPPQPRNRIEAVVAAAPGAPAHVLLTDTEAEHLPGCNLAIRKTALNSIGGFHPQYRVAGDDVDVCWRLREMGGQLHFIPGAMVWHHRRYTVGAYLRQQRGYGRAEALLMKDHPERFGPLGGARWFGGIYGDRAASLTLNEGSIFHGPLGEGLFQGIYQHGPRCWLDWMGGVLWVLLFILALALQSPFTAAVILCLSLALAACRLISLTNAPFALNPRESCLLLGLCWWQPVLREWERLLGMVRLGTRPKGIRSIPVLSLHSKPRKMSFRLAEFSFWSESGRGRREFLEKLKEQLQKKSLSVREDDGWRLFDLEAVPPSTASEAYLTVTEYHGQAKQLTRVRLILRLRFHILLILLLPLLAACIPSPLQDLAQDALSVLAVGILSIMCIAPIFWKRLTEDILKAAEMAGLSRIKK